MVAADTRVSDSISAPSSSSWGSRVGDSEVDCRRSLSHCEQGPAEKAVAVLYRHVSFSNAYEFSAWRCLPKTSGKFYTAANFSNMLELSWCLFWFFESSCNFSFYIMFFTYMSQRNKALHSSVTVWNLKHWDFNWFSFMLEQPPCLSLCLLASMLFYAIFPWIDVSSALTIMLTILSCSVLSLQWSPSFLWMLMQN